MARKQDQDSSKFHGANSCSRAASFRPASTRTIALPRFLQRQISRAKCFDSAGVKVALKIRQQFGEFRGRFDFFKSFGGVEGFRHLRKIGRIIRAQKNFAARCESNAGQRWKPFIDEPVFLVPRFRPGIGKVDMDGRGGMRRQKMLEKIGGFDADTANVRKAGSAAFAV